MGSEVALRCFRVGLGWVWDTLGLFSSGLKVASGLVKGRFKAVYADLGLVKVGYIFSGSRLPRVGCVLPAMGAAAYQKRRGTQQPLKLWMQRLSL